MKKETMIIDCAQCSHQGNGCPGFNDCIIYKNIWEQRRWEAAKDAMKGILSNKTLQPGSKKVRNTCLKELRRKPFYWPML